MGEDVSVLVSLNHRGDTVLLDNLVEGNVEATASVIGAPMYAGVFTGSTVVTTTIE
jgi:hypothetical protein